MGHRYLDDAYRGKNNGEMMECVVGAGTRYEAKWCWNCHSWIDEKHYNDNCGDN